jgi:hypothetical protein
LGGSDGEGVIDEGGETLFVGMIPGDGRDPPFVGHSETDVDDLAEAEGVTMAEIIRRALDGYLDEQPDPRVALAATYGAAPDAEVPGRGEWDRG